jgi:hypothetical protein
LNGPHYNKFIRLVTTLATIIGSMNIMERRVNARITRIIKKKVGATS